MQNRTLIKTFFFSMFIFVSAIANASTGDSLGLSPFWDWKEIETEHFRIVFPSELTPQAKRVAEIYEQAHVDLKRDLRWEPSTRANVLVIDNADSANGLTTPVSRFGMILYMTPPDPFFSTDSYDDWLRLLIYHEYTHFLNMDATRGFWSFARVLFGDVLLPNSLWPAWMLEGYAVYNETKYTKTGRGRSAYWEGILRSIVEENALGRSDTITLDEINGEHPHFPTGEVPYLFGYHLMNAVERSKPGALGEMSERSSYRFPYFINGNLENITGRDWYTYWNEWVKSTNEKMKTQIARLHSVPVSKVERIDGTADSSFGIAFSPDQKWAAYSTQSDDHWQTLKLREWKNGATPKVIEDKFLGETLAFTPDSSRIVYSSLHRKSNYYTWSDLRAYDLKTGAGYWLTDGARARDPDLSYDGIKITYTVASEAGTDLMIANLSEKNGHLFLNNPTKLVDAPAYDRLATPRFSKDGKSIVFGWKTEGKVGERLFTVSSTGGKPTELMADGSRNRFPAYDLKGNLYFVSDRTGVDNLYRFEPRTGKSTLVTNVIGALWLPNFRGNDLYASVLSKDGFSLARVEIFSQGIDPLKVRLELGSDAPKAATGAPTQKRDDAVENYSALHTLLPRQWSPIFFGDENSTYIGGEMVGYDNTFRHQYIALGAYDTTSASADYYARYENRVLGPTLSLYSSLLTKDVRSAKTNGGNTATFTRDFESGASLSFPFNGMTSSFTPTLSASIEKNAYYARTAQVSRLLGRDRSVPEQDLLLEYTSTRSSRLAVTNERGNITRMGVRRYDLGPREVYKGIFSHTQYFDLGRHFVLFPRLKAMKVSRVDYSYLDSVALTQGKRDRIFDPIYSDSFDEFGIRGYPNTGFYSHEAISLSTDMKFPLAQIFRGWGTNPFFLNQLSMQIFGEDTYRPSASPRYQHLPSAGAGLRLGLDALLVLPLTLGLDYHYGFNKDAFGQGEVFVSVTAASLLPF